MARAVLRGLAKNYGGAPALAPFEITLEDGDLVAVLGPSGCGKSTLLRLIAGLERPDAGEISLDGRRIDELPPGERDVAMVFQSYALYPHMSVRENIEFPLEMRGVERRERSERVQEIAGLLELLPLLSRRPAALSGGERQRVALARALVRRPALFLLDEPLSNLDARLRAHVRRFFRELQRRLEITTIYVTHDQTEAMTLGRRVVVLDRGQVQQVAAPLDLWERPANRFVASFVGTPPMNLIQARHADGAIRLADQTLLLPAELRRRLGPMSDVVTLGVRAEAFRPVELARSDELVAIPEPGSRELLGGETLFSAWVGDEPVLVRLFGTASLLPGRVAAPVSSLHFFDRSGTRIGP